MPNENKHFMATFAAQHPRVFPRHESNPQLFQESGWCLHSLGVWCYASEVQLMTSTELSTTEGLGQHHVERE